MTKHRMRDLIKSLFRSHIDPEWNEQLKGTRAEIEDRVTKVLKLSSGSDTEQLSELIQDLHKKYQSICDQYSNLTEEIQNKVDEKNDASSSSSSDSDDSVEKKGSRNREGESAKIIIEDLKKELELAKLEVDESKKKKEAVDRELETAMEVNQSITSQLPILKDEKAALQKELGAVNGEVRRMKQKMADLMEENQSLTSKLSNQRDELKFQLEKRRRESSEMETQKSKFITQIEEKEEEYRKLSEEHQIVQHQFKKCKASLESVETKLEATETEFRLMKVAKEQEVAELEEMMDELKRDLELKGDEASSSVECVRNLEVRLRLSNQKYRVTDQLLTEKEDKFRARETEYEKQIKCLEDKIWVLSETAASYKRMVLDVAGEVNSAMEGFDSVVQKLGDGYRNHTRSIMHVGGEIMVVKNWVREAKSERRRVEEERAEAGKMREKVERLEAEEAEKVKLAAEMKEMRKKGAEMELELKEIKVGAAVLGEEKREAIRQLCVWVDYQRSRCEDLKDVVAKLKASRG